MLEYETAADGQIQSPPVAAYAPSSNRSSGADTPRLPAPVSRLDVIGAGNFARTMLLPHLKGLVPFGTVVNNTSLSANHVKTKFGFSSGGDRLRRTIRRVDHRSGERQSQPPCSSPPGIICTRRWSWRRLRRTATSSSKSRSA